jgi:DNA-binding response OmpR family regulator
MKRILMVEDQPDIRKLIRMTLEFEDFEVHEAEDGERGLEQVMAVKPDLVLLDVMLPGTLDGLEVCRRIRAHPELARLPVLMVTARGMATDVEAGRAAGADEYLFKPFSPHELIETIERMIGQA